MASKVEDELLVKKVKAGKIVERNERQIKQLEDMNKGERHLNFKENVYTSMIWGSVTGITVNTGYWRKSSCERLYFNFSCKFFLMTELKELSGSIAVNEYTILCGRCKKKKIVPMDRTNKAKTTYFKKS